MRHNEFLEQAINKGIAAARRDYHRPDQQEKLSGSIAGFEACRQKDPQQLKELLDAARISAYDARINHLPDYWWYRCYELEVGWICNVVSAVLFNQNLPTIVPPTARAMLTAAEIVGVKR